MRGGIMQVALSFNESPDGREIDGRPRRQRKMKRMIEKPTIAAGIALAAAILGWPTARAQNAELANPRVITDASRPLVELKGMLESAYSRPVTYEESVLVWQGDLGVSPDIRSAKPDLALAPKHRSFQLPFRSAPLRKLATCRRSRKQTVASAPTPIRDHKIKNST
jgi:hypothetical protein